MQTQDDAATAGGAIVNPRYFGPVPIAVHVESITGLAGIAEPSYDMVADLRGVLMPAETDGGSTQVNYLALEELAVFLISKP